MPLSFKIFVLASAAFFICCCSVNNLHDLETKEFEKLEDSLIKLANSPEANWIDNLNYVKKIKIKSERVLKTQNLCVLAYEKYSDAMIQLMNAKRQVATIADNPTIKDVKSLKQDHKQAQKAIADTSRFLDEAEKLVKQCSQKRANLRNVLAGD